MDTFSLWFHLYLRLLRWVRSILLNPNPKSFRYHHACRYRNWSTSSNRPFVSYDPVYRIFVSTYPQFGMPSFFDLNWRQISIPRDYFISIKKLILVAWWPSENPIIRCCYPSILHQFYGYLKYITEAYKSNETRC